MKPTVLTVFEKELNLIHDETVLGFTVLAFQHHCPDYFWTIPASVRGHHPPVCRTRGGLVHHVKLAVAFADQLLESLGIDDLDPRHSQIIAAVMLHDMMKRGRTENELDTWPEHRIANRSHGRYCANILSTRMCVPAEVEDVIEAIKLHMGQWTIDVTQQELSVLHFNEVVRTTHLADYIASRALHQLLAERHTDKTMGYISMTKMSCPNCGGAMSGDGYTTPLHCERIEAPNIEPDATPVFCAKTCASCDAVRNDGLITCVGCGAQTCFYVEGCGLCEIKMRCNECENPDCVGDYKCPEYEPFKVTAFELKLALLDYFRFERQWVAVDEFSGADVICDTGTKVIEVEVKVAKNDLVNGEKYKVLKHIAYGEGRAHRRCHPNEFYFCVPDRLMDDAIQVIEALNPKYGLFVFYEERLLADLSSGYKHEKLSEYLSCVRRARKLHTGYSQKQRWWIAKRATSKLITQMQTEYMEKMT